MSAEQNRTQASQQYFEIRNELNRSNRTKNLKTELEFELREDVEEYFIIIKSTGAENGLRLAFRRKNETLWLQHENEIYTDFYKYMFLKISRTSVNNEININHTLTDWLLRLWMG